MPAGKGGRQALALGSADFAAILKSPTRRRTRHFTLFWRASEVPRLGTVVSNKLSGGAVRRNLVKRHARAMFQQWCRERIANDAPGFDLVIRVAADIRALSRNAEFDEMRALFSQLAASVAGSTK